MAEEKRWKKLYERRKANGECPRCGKKMDREGHYCQSCLEMCRADRNATRQFLREIGICPICHKNALIGDERNCLECRAYYAARREKNKITLTEERLQHNRDNSKKLYRNRIDNNKCTRCGKRSPAVGRKKCAICLEKDAEIHRLKRFGGVQNGYTFE